MAGAKKAAKKAPAKKASKKAPAKKATKKTATKTAKTAKKASTKKAAKKAPAKKKAAKKAPAKKKAAKKAPAKKKAATKAPAKKKAAKKSPFDKKFLDAQKALLEEERRTYERQATNLQAEADELAAQREPGDVQFDEESGEGDTLAVERERDLAMSAQARAMISEIDAALDRIRAGTYGICEVSGQSIPKERLKAIPWARERVEFKVGGFSRR